MLIKRSFTSSILNLVGLCVVLGLTGCGGRADVAKATGVITLNGEPVPEAKVMFHPKDGGSRTSYGTTNEKGEFKASTYGMHDGALVGHHIVTITKIDTKDQVQFDATELAQKGYSGKGYEAMMGPNAAKNRAKQKFIIPEKYSSKDTSGIEVDVVKGEVNNFPLDLDASVPAKK